MFERVVTTLALVFCIVYSVALMRDGTPVGLVWFLGVGTGIWFINAVDAYKNRS